MAMAAATICSVRLRCLPATAVKDWLAEHKAPGRVRYYGCPAEEGGAAKAFMVRVALSTTPISPSPGIHRASGKWW